MATSELARFVQACAAAECAAPTALLACDQLAWAWLCETANWSLSTTLSWMSPLATGETFTKNSRQLTTTANCESRRVRRGAVPQLCSDVPEAQLRWGEGYAFCIAFKT